MTIDLPLQAPTAAGTCARVDATKLLMRAGTSFSTSRTATRMALAKASASALP